MEAWLKRELGKAEREAQLLAHKAHFVLLLAHLKYVNDCLGGNVHASESTQTLLGLAMSIVPPAHMTKSSGESIAKFTRMFSQNMYRRFLPNGRTVFQGDHPVYSSKQAQIEKI